MKRSAVKCTNTFYRTFNFIAINMQLRFLKYYVQFALEYILKWIISVNLLKIH